MTETERLLHNFLARAAYLLADIRTDLLQYPNDSAASGFVCDIDNYFSETYSWLKALERAQKHASRGASSAPPVVISGDAWRPPPATAGESCTTSATDTPPASSPGTSSESSTSESPAASSTPPSTSSRPGSLVDFF